MPQRPRIRRAQRVVQQPGPGRAGHKGLMHDANLQGREFRALSRDGGKRDIRVRAAVPPVERDAAQARTVQRTDGEQPLTQVLDFAELEGV